MIKIQYILFALLLSQAAFAKCQKHEVKTNHYKSQLTKLKARHCFFPETGERKPCMETELGQEVKIKKLASQTLLLTCNSSESRRIKRR